MPRDHTMIGGVSDMRRFSDWRRVDQAAYGYRQLLRLLNEGEEDVYCIHMYGKFQLNKVEQIWLFTVETNVSMPCRLRCSCAATYMHSI